MQEVLKQGIAKVKAGQLSPARFEAGLRLRSAGERILKDGLRDAFGDLREHDFVEIVSPAVSALRKPEVIALLGASLTRASASWGEEYVADTRPLRALDAFRRCPHLTTDQLAEHSDHASSARDDLDYPAFTDLRDPKRARAMWFASAVADALVGLVELSEGKPANFVSASATSLVFCARASTDPSDEVRHLFDTLHSLILTGDMPT